MATENYYRKKAEFAKFLYDHGRPFVKVYGAVRDGDKFLVLEHGENRFQLSGGGVDDGETLEDAMKRELKEELNVEVKILRHLGVYDKLYKTWELDGEKFDIQYEIHVFDTEVIKKLDGRFGLDGEFGDGDKIVRVDKQFMLNNIAEFRDFKIPF